MNWLHVTPTTAKTRSAYSSCNASSAPYCGVSPHLLATLTTRAARPPVSAPSVVGSPSRVVRGRSRRSLMACAALRRGRSFQAADVVGDVDRVLPQGLERHDLQRALV